VDTVNT